MFCKLQDICKVFNSNPLKTPSGDAFLNIVTENLSSSTTSTLYMTPPRLILTLIYMLRIVITIIMQISVILYIFDLVFSLFIFIIIFISNCSSFLINHERNLKAMQTSNVAETKVTMATRARHQFHHFLQAVIKGCSVSSSAVIVIPVTMLFNMTILRPLYLRKNIDTGYNIS